MRILVTGDRNWEDYEVIKSVLDQYAISLIINGGARGADHLSTRYAMLNGIDWLVFAADWATYHRAAGAIRNIKMLEISEPDLVIAFHGDLSKSKGTIHCINEARKRGISVRVVNE